MRTYACNSPEAAGRILALLLIADGHVCASEISALGRLEAERRLGLQPGAIAALLRDLCEDLMTGAHHQGSLLDGLDGAALRAIMEEVTEPRLRSEVLTLAQAAARADAHLADGEAFILAAACRYWSLSPDTLATPTAVAA